MKRQIFPTASKYRCRTRREFGGETVEYIIVILAVVVIGGGLMGFGNQVSGQIGITGNSISSWFGKANGAGDNASGGNGGGGNNAGGGNKGDENSGSQLQAPTVSVTGMDVVGERVIAKVSNLPEGVNQVSYQWQYSPTKTGTFSDIKYGGNKNSYEISEEDEDYYLRCKVTTSSSKGKVPDRPHQAMGQKDGSQMRVPFGLDEHGNAVWADQISYDRNGFKCGLVCPDPNCGKRLKAVRCSKDDPERGIHYLAHEANSRCAVESNPESLLHLEAKAVLKGLIGHDFYLPNLSLIDSVPHTSRYRNAGKLEFKKYGKLTVLPVPGSSVLKFSPETYKSFIPGTGCMTKIEDVKTERDCGAMCPEGLIPDAVALLSHADTEIWVAIEFRVSHPKAIEDVRKYATVDFPVMEISITDDIANAGDTRKSLAERITGTGHATRFAGREWLYSPAAKKILKRSWHIEAEPSDKPLRHKGTDLVRLETPLPAITVYAVKGAPTGETSWDNIDLTLREISEATVEKQEEALRKKRSLSSRCPSYKNSAPAGRQIKQTEDTGFETPTKPHGILGRLKGLFGKFRK